MAEFLGHGGGIEAQIGEYPNPIPDKGYVDAKNTERYRLHLTGDKAEVYRTDLLQKNLFPEVPGEKFLTECLVWNEIAYQGYKLRWFPDVIMITEYRDDGLTKNLNKIKWDNFVGYTLEVKSEMRSGESYRFRVLGRYLTMAKKKGMKKDDIMAKLGISSAEYKKGKRISYLQNISDMTRGRKK